VLTKSNKDLNGNTLATPIVFGEYYSPPDFPQFVDDDAITLAGLFKWRGEAIDWQLDATSPSGEFVPHCPITVQLLLQGGNCAARLAWYNVSDPTAKKPPKKAELYEIVPANLADFMSCQTEFAPKTDGFCPLAWDNRFPQRRSR
jgi:hypothetical protein